MNEKHIPVCKGGGIYHSHKVQYTKETQQLVKKLLNESKLSIIQQTVLNNMVKNGDPLPKAAPVQSKRIVTALQVKPNTTKKRTKDAIEASGAYMREKYVPVNNKPNHDDEKVRLQSLMAYGTDIQVSLNDETPKNKFPNTSRKEVTKDEMFNELIFEIEERAQFLKDMEMLGEEKQYKDIIENEITSKMRQMEMLDKERYKKQTGVVENFRKKFRMEPLLLPSEEFKSKRK